MTASGTGNTARVDGRMDSSKCQQISEANVTQSVKKRKLKRGWLLTALPKWTLKSIRKQEIQESILEMNENVNRMF